MRVVVAIAAAAAVARAWWSTPAGGIAELAATPAQVWVSDGTIHAIAATPRSVYVGGEFNLLGPVPPGLGRARALGRRRPRRGRPSTGTSQRAVADGRGGWYLAGNFRSVGGVARAQARPAAERSHRRPELEPPAGTGSVSALARRGERAVVGGDFAKVAGKPEHGFARARRPHRPASPSAAGAARVDERARVEGRLAVALRRGRLLPDRQEHALDAPAFDARSRQDRVAPPDAGPDRRR